MPGEWSRLRWVCFGVQVGFKLLSEGGQGRRGTNLIRKSIPHSGSIKSKTITKLFDRFMNRRAKLWTDKEVTTTLTAPGTIRTAVGRKIWSKIPGKICVKILINKCGCLEHCELSYSGGESMFTSWKWFRLTLLLNNYFQVNPCQMVQIDSTLE